MLLLGTDMIETIMSNLQVLASGMGGRGGSDQDSIRDYEWKSVYNGNGHYSFFFFFLLFHGLWDTEGREIFE